MKLPTINQKEIVPVRLVPIITARNIGQQRLAGILTHKLKVNGFPRISPYDEISVSVDGEVRAINKSQLLGSNSNDIDIYAYHLNDNGEPVRMLSTEWDDIYQEMSILEPILRKEEGINGVPDSKETTWLIESLKILPPGVFLWREDMDKLWQVYNKQLSMPGERKDSRIINYDAYV